MELRLVSGYTAFVFDATGDALKDDARQAPLGKPLDVTDAQCVPDLHLYAAEFKLLSASKGSVVKACLGKAPCARQPI